MRQKRIVKCLMIVVPSVKLMSVFNYTLTVTEVGKTKHEFNESLHILMDY